ncbi:MAG: histidine kinase [Acidobacteria bacterium]|nr:histidine kinase [Acidobacteriota bacterium]
MREQMERLIRDMVDRGILFEDALRAFEKSFVTEVLSRSDGSLTGAARTLGIHRNTLSRKMAEHRLRRR